MRYLILATDFDGTLAKHGQVSPNTLAALDRVIASGRKVILVTGRHLPDLRNVFPQLDRFERVIAENGALLYDPANNEEIPLSEPPAAPLIALLEKRGIPFAAGRSVIASWEPHQAAIIDAIRELGLDSHVIFNKGAVMVLPSGVNKGSGLLAALKSLELSPHNAVGIGDGENDHALVASCECGVAVANAVPALKDRADLITTFENGRGVEELIEQLLKDDLASYDTHLSRHTISLGTMFERSQQEIRIGPCRHSILIAGASASGKSTLAAGFLEQLTESRYQFCLVDPEGDYDNLSGTLSFGTPRERPDPNAVLNALRMPENNVVINLLAMRVNERPGYFSQLLPRLIELRAQTARPHWIILDEAHHLLPPSWSPASSTLPPALGGMVLITVHPEQISRAALDAVEVVITTGKSALEPLAGFAAGAGVKPPSASKTPSESGEALVWFKGTSPQAALIKTRQARGERKRHRRQYAEGELSPEQSFYFVGPESKLHLRAQNLNTFLQLAEGVDDETWNHHLGRGDYSRWFEQVIKDHELADETKKIEQESTWPAAESRKKIKQAVESRYTVAT